MIYIIYAVYILCMYVYIYVYIYICVYIYIYVDIYVCRYLYYILYIYTIVSDKIAEAATCAAWRPGVGHAPDERLECGQ